MATFELLLGLIALSVALQWAAEHLNVAPAVLFVLGGMGVALTPGLPALELDPGLALALFLPPLLQLSAYRTDWPVFKSNLRPILLLAIGAVFFTAIAVALVAHWISPELPWWAAVTLGAIVAPPDAVAASAVLKRFSLPKRLLVVLEGESLVNDASALVLYRFAIASAVAGTASFSTGALQFVATAAGGVLIGALTARIAILLFTRIDNTLLDITLSILAGFVAYLTAEAVHASGVLGAVSCGLLLGRKQHADFTAQTRLELNAVWNFVEFLLSSLVFLLIGLQLRGIVARLDLVHLDRLALLGIAIATTLVASRFVWVYVSAWLPRLLSKKLRVQDPLPPWTHQAVVGWAGMRGVVSMAAALALPIQFPGRDLIILLAFCAILVTLLVQGTTLGWLIRRLEVKDDEAPDAAKQEAVRVRADLAAAALDAVQTEAAGKATDGDSDAAHELIGEYRAKAEHANVDNDDLDRTADQHLAQQRVRLRAIEAARKKWLESTDEIDTERHRALGHELDLEEQQVRKALGEE